jgi:N-formylglutamate amidohydrolase
VILEAARSFIAERGFVVAVNAPYAGGFTTGFYGHPSVYRHALQIEINRAINMNERSYRRKPSFARSSMTWPALFGGSAKSRRIVFQ